jgi:ribosome-associated toxin RatA of RatAB toxin-antitoxin module
LVYNLNVTATILNKNSTGVIGARLFVPVSAREIYEVVLDVHTFPRWAPGVRRVEVVKGPPGPGMISEWEVSFLGLRRKISSVLEEAEPPTLLRWTYEGLVRGWGQCVLKDWGDAALAEFRTELHLAEPVLERLMRASAVRSAATLHLKRSLTRLGQVVSGNGRVRVGPIEGIL